MAEHRGRCAAAGRAADRHGLRCAHHSPRHALRDGGGRQLGDDRRHPGRADGTAQGPGLRPRQLHDPRPAARLRRHARSRRREAQPAALADEAGSQGRSAGGELRRSSRCRREPAAFRSGRAVDAQRAPGCALVRRAGAQLRRAQRRYRQGADQLGAAHLGVRGRQGGARRQRGQRRAGAQPRRRASADRRHAGVQRART